LNENVPVLLYEKPDQVTGEYEHHRTQPVPQDFFAESALASWVPIPPKMVKQFWKEDACEAANQQALW
jgi:hypothetical protein